MLEVARPRPERWDKPLDESMTDQVIDRLLRVPPFSAMKQQAFPRATPLRELLRNDTRLVEFQPGEIIVREGDYGSCALLVLDGQVRATLESLPPDVLGRAPKRRGTQILRAVAKLLRPNGAPSRVLLMRHKPPLLGQGLACLFKIYPSCWNRHARHC